MSRLEQTLEALLILEPKLPAEGKGEAVRLLSPLIKGSEQEKDLIQEIWSFCPHLGDIIEELGGDIA